MQFGMEKKEEVDNLREEELIRSQSRQLWCDMVVAVSNDSRVVKLAVATSWADDAVKEFNKRFGNK